MMRKTNGVDKRAQKKYDVLADGLNALHGIAKDDVPMLPPQCPRCGGFKMTQVLGTKSIQECLDCKKMYQLKAMKEG